MGSYNILVPADVVPDAVPVVGTLDDLIPFIASMIIQDKMSRKTN